MYIIICKKNIVCKFENDFLSLNGTVVAVYPGIRPVKYCYQRIPETGVTHSVPVRPGLLRPCSMVMNEQQ